MHSRGPAPNVVQADLERLGGHEAPVGQDQIHTAGLVVPERPLLERLHHVALALSDPRHVDGDEAVIVPNRAPVRARSATLARKISFLLSRAGDGCSAPTRGSRLGVLIAIAFTLGRKTLGLRIAQGRAHCWCGRLMRGRNGDTTRGRGASTTSSAGCSSRADRQLHRRLLGD